MLKKTTYKDIWAFTWYYWRQQKVKLSAFLVVMGSAAFLDTLFPVLAGNLVNQVEQAAANNNLSWTKGIVTAFLLLAGLEFLYHGTRQGGMFLWNSFAVKTLYQIITEGFDKVQRFSTDWHANSFAGATVRKLTRGMWSFDMYEDIFGYYLYPTTIVLLTIIITMGLKWPIMGLVAAISIILYVGVSIWSVLVINAPNFQRSADADTDVGAALADSITANATVKAFGTEKSEDERFAVVARNWQRCAIKAWQVATATDLLRRYTSVLIMLGMSGTALWLWQKGQASVGDIVYVFTSTWIIFAYTRVLGEQIANLQKSVSEMEDIVAFWKREDEIQDKPNAAIFTPKEGKITFDEVRFTYENQGTAIYDDFTIHIQPGEKVALVGHSGSGKSTFVKLVQRLYDIQGGEIRIDSQNIADVTQESLRRAISLVPQEPILFHRSLSDNIAYGRPGASQEEIIEAAKQAYAHDFIETLSQGYETLVGERGIKLSGGERQRVAIARAILADAPILILDEATSSLDSISEHYIQLALKGLMDGRTTITIAHRLSTIKSVDRILVFNQGRIVEQGTHAELVNQEGSHYKELYDMQALGLVDQSA